MILFVLEPVSCIAELSVERQSRLRRRWRSSGLVQDTNMCGGMAANRFGLLVLCFLDWFFFPSEVNTKDLCSTVYVSEIMEKRSERFFVTFVSCPVPFIYILPTGNECGQKPIAMYVISGQFRRWSIPFHLNTSSHFVLVLLSVFCFLLDSLLFSTVDSPANVRFNTSFIQL